MSRRGFPASRRRVEVPNSPLLDPCPRRKSRFCAILERLFPGSGRVWWGGRPFLGQIAAARCRPGRWCRSRIDSRGSSRPLKIPHLAREKGLIMFLVPHRFGAISGIFGCPVGRSVGLRSETAQRQQRRGFPPLGKFTYEGLSEVRKRSERDVMTICAIKAGSAPPWWVEGAASKCQLVAIDGQRAVC